MDIKISVELATTFRAREHWYAIDDNYDGAPDANSPQGSGSSKWEAVRDLIDQLEEQESD